jgi:hypothetical protein
MSNQTNNNIYPKPCNYGCNTQIYWNSSVNEYWEVFTKKKHICPNRSTNNKNKYSVTPPSNASKPYYYNNTRKASSFSASSNPKPKMSNSFEYLQGSIAEIQKKYETLSDIVTEHNGKVHGSQRDRDPKTGLIDLLVYYEVPLGQRDEVKRKFENYVLTANSLR